MDIGSGELFLIFLLALLVYGGRLPEVVLAVGRTVGRIKRTIQDTTDMIRVEVDLEQESQRTVRRADELPYDDEDALDDGYDEYDDEYEDDFIDDGELATEDISGEPPIADGTTSEVERDSDQERAGA